MERTQPTWFDVFITQERPVWSPWVCQEFKRKKKTKERKYRKSSLIMKSTRSMWKRRKRCRVSKRRWKKIVHVALLCSQCLLCSVMTSVSYTADGDGFPHFHILPNKAGYSYIWVTRGRSWSRHCARSRKVAGVFGILLWHNPSGHTMALGLTKLVTEMNTTNISWG